MTYYIEKEGKILFADEDLNRLKDTLLFRPDLTEKDIKKTKRNEIIDNFELVTKADYNIKQANKKREELVNTLYEMKAKKAYGGVIINKLLKFETNQTAITNTIASLSLMSDDNAASWKFYTIDGAPYMQLISKAQLAYIARFGQDMINQSFKIEGLYNEQLRAATEENLLSEVWVKEFIDTAQNSFNQILNTLEIDFEAKDDNTDANKSDSVSDEVDTKDSGSTAEQNNNDTDTIQETETTDTGSENK